jgi:hypothetical protein
VRNFLIFLVILSLPIILYSCSPPCWKEQDSVLGVVFFDSDGEKLYKTPYDTIMVQGHYKKAVYESNYSPQPIYLNPNSDQTTFILIDSLGNYSDTLTIGYSLDYDFAPNSRCEFTYEIKDIKLISPTSFEHVTISGNEVQIHF